MGGLPRRQTTPQERLSLHQKHEKTLADRDKRERRRIFASWLITLLIYGSVILLSILLNLKMVIDMADKSGPLAVKIGNPDALDLPPTKPETPPEAQVPDEQPAPSAEPEVSAPPEPDQVKPSAIIKDEPKPTPVPTAKPSSQPSAKPTSKPTAKPSSKPSSKPSTRPSPNTTPPPDLSPRPSAQASVLPKQQPSVSSAANTPVLEQILPKGHDNGNSYETSFFNVKGFVGRNGGTPISQYMPLPKLVLGAIHANIGSGKLKVPSATRQLEIFDKAYVPAGNNYQLRNDNVSLDERDQLWAILEGAGYDTKRAEYKYRRLNSIVLEFTLGVPNGGRVEVKGIRVVQSSGDGSIDDAVVYGFKTIASFSNPTKEEVKGRFTYNFE